MIKQTPLKRVLLARAYKALTVGLFGVILVLILSGAFTSVIPNLFGKPQKVQAATNSTLNFQARLLTSTGAVVPDGNYHIEFKLYSVASGVASPLWTETRTTGNLVRVVNGYFSVNLGSVTAFPALNWDQDLYITMNIGGTAGSASWDGEMTNGGTRMKLTGVPYAFRAGQLAKTSGSFTSVLDFTTPTANRSILLPNLGGTVALTSNNQTFSSTQTFSGTLSVTGTSSLTGGIITLGDAITDNLTIGAAIQGANAIYFDGATNDTFETALAVTDPTQDNTITLPNAPTLSGIVSWDYC